MRRTRKMRLPRPLSRNRRGALGRSVSSALCVAIATMWTLSHEAIVMGQQSVSGSSTIRVGMSTALTGPSSDLGVGMKLGVEVCFAAANDSGGIDGRVLELVAYDDGYEPSQTIVNMRRLIKDDEVVAIIGNVGTPTATVAVPIANECKTLLFGAFSGADILRRSPPDRYVINYRASYQEEICAIIDDLSDKRGVVAADIAFFTQADAYGDSGFAGSLAALRRRGRIQSLDLTHVEYQRNTLDVEGALASLLECQPVPKAVVLVGASAPCAKFISLARENGFDPVFWNLSFVGDDSFASKLGSWGEGVLITQVVPNPRGDVPIVKDYMACLHKYGRSSEPSYVSLEGFVVGRIFVESLRRVEGKLDRESVIDALESLRDVDVGLGFPISFSADDHQASHRMWMTVIEDGRLRELDRVDDAGLIGVKR